MKSALHHRRRIGHILAHVRIRLQKIPRHIPRRPRILAKRRILSSIEEVTEDGQGRAQLPKSFREYAGLVKDVITVGMGDYVEIWAQEQFEQSVGKMSIQQANALAYKRSAES